MFLKLWKLFIIINFRNKTRVLISKRKFMQTQIFCVSSENISNYKDNDFVYFMI